MIREQGLCEVPLNDVPTTNREVADEIDAAWRAVVGSSAFIGGPFVETFEHEWAAYCGTRAAVGVGNGTDAIVLTLRALGIGRGDEVLVPANTFIATPEAVVLAGAAPRFVDVDPQTLLVTPASLEGGLNERTAAVIVVHLYGSIPEMSAIQRWAQKNHLAVIEDAAQAHGATRSGQKAGSFGTAGCFSFYPGKNLGALGDAGAVVTDDQSLARRLRSLSNHGRAGSKDSHTTVGTNSRLDGLQAAILSCKLPRLDGWNAARRFAMGCYQRLLDGGQVRAVLADCESAHHQAVFTTPDRDRIRAYLRRHGIESAVHYPVPCHQHEPYKRFAPDRLPVAEASAREILSLPLFPHLTGDQIRYVCRHLNQYDVGLEDVG